MNKAEIGEKFMEFMEKEFGVTFVDVTPVDTSAISVSIGSLRTCEKCSHYLVNHTLNGCMGKCACKVKVKTK